MTTEPGHAMARKLLAVLVEDNAELRSYFTMSARSDPDLQTVEAPDLASGIALCQEQPSVVLIVDLGLPDAKGVEAVGRLRMEKPGATLVVITGSEDLKEAALAAGAHKVIIKASPESGLKFWSIVRQAVEDHQRELYFVGAHKALDRQEGVLDTVEKKLDQLKGPGAGKVLSVLLLVAAAVGAEAKARDDAAVTEMRMINAVRALGPIPDGPRSGSPGRSG